MLLEIKNLKKVLNSDDEPTTTNEDAPQDQPAEGIDSNEQSNGGNELLNKINMLQAEIDKLKPNSDESSEKE